MTNAYYEFSPAFVPGTKVRSDAVNTQYEGVQSGFDLLPAIPGSLALGTATFGAEAQGATVNDYEVTMPDTRVANADGDEVVFIATHTNIGGATLNIDGIGAVPLVRADGMAVAANDIQSGLFYTARFDNANTRFQLIGPSQSYLTNAAASATAAAASATAALLSEMAAAISETASAASAAASLVSEGLAMEWAVNVVDNDISTSPGMFSALHWSAGAQDWATRAEDDPIPVNFGGGAGQFSAFHWAQKSAAASGGGLLQGTGVIAPTAGLPYDYDVELQFQNANAQATARIGFDGVSTFDVQVQSRGSVMRLLGTNAAGSTVTLAALDPDGAVILNFDGDTAFFTTTDGATFRTNSVTDNPVLRAEDMSGTEVGQLQFNNTANSLGLVLNSAIDSGLVSLASQDAASAITVLAQGNPDGAFDEYFAGELKTRTTASGIDVLGNSSFDRTLLQLYDAAGTTTVGGLIWNGPAFGDEIDLRGAIPGGEVIITQVDAAGIVPKVHLRAISDGATELSFNNLLKLSTTTTGVNVLGSLNNDPATSGNQDAEVRLLNSSAQLAARVGFFASSTNFEIRNTVHGGAVRLVSEDIGGVARSGLVFDPDGQVEAYFAGVLKFTTATTGINVFGSLNNDPTTGGIQNAQLNFNNSGGTEVGDIAWLSATTLSIRNLVHGGLLELRGQNTGGTNRTGLVFDPDGNIQLFQVGSAVARTETAANGGFEVNNTLTGGGFERALTTGDLAVQVRRKSINTTRTNDASVSDDPHLAGFSLEANQMYEINAVLSVSVIAGGTTPGFQLAWQYSGSFGTGSQMGYLNKDNAGVVQQNDATTGGVSFDMEVSSTHVWIKGYFRVSTAGTLDFQWAQVNSSGNSTTLQAGSFISVVNMRLGGSGTSAVHS